MPHPRCTAAVLFDFDGPICDLFSHRRAPDIARALLDALQTKDVVLPPTTDPHGLLADLPKSLFEQVPDPAERDDLIALADELLAGEEVEAARSACPTPGALEALAELVERGTPLAVVSNNARGAIVTYLAGRGPAAERLARHVVGRPADPARMKPDASGIRAALAELGVPDGAASRCVFVGDAPSDAEAAAVAGVRFLGWAGHRQYRRDRLRAAGVPNEDIFDEWSSLVAATR